MQLPILMYMVITLILVVVQICADLEDSCDLENCNKESISHSDQADRSFLYKNQHKEDQQMEQQACKSESESEGCTDWKSLTEDQWAQRLPPDTFAVARQGHTEPPFQNQYFDHKGNGIYACACCGTELFRSDTKYDSGSGWPSFFDAIDKRRIIRKVDSGRGMKRMEILCATCNAHLGHVFEDGPEPTGERYCVNSASIGFMEKSKQ